MSIGKIILASFAAIVVIGIVSFLAISSVSDVETSPKIINEPTLEKTEPVSIPGTPQYKPEFTEKEFPTYLSNEQKCIGTARCIEGFVSRVIDGDTIVVGDKSIRFAIVNTPEYGDYDYSQARAYIETICPVGSKVLVDEDDAQTGGSHGRIIAKIYCNELNLNEEILEVGHAEILQEFCSISEFAGESWAQKHGCSDT